MDAPAADATTRAQRILAEKLDLLYHNTVAILANLVIAGVVCLLFRETFPHAVLLAWLAAMAGVCAMRLRLQHQFRRTPVEQRCSTRAVRHFAVGALVSGLLWGVLSVGLSFWGDRDDVVVMVLTFAGLIAGAVASISVSYVAYLCYAGSFVIPVALVTLFSPDPDITGIGVMIVIYVVAVAVIARRTNRLTESTIALRVDNQVLQVSLAETAAERDRARSDKWTALSQLSHELRTPLNAILGFSEAMHGEIFGALGHRRYKEYVEHIQAGGQELLNLAEELLLLSQGESGALTLDETEVDTCALLHRLAEQRRAAAKAGLVLTVEAAPDLPPLKADRAKLRQMVLHLIDNAVKFTPAGGKISLTARRRPDSGIDITVSDTGIGMAPSQIPTALQPFGRIGTALTDNTAGAGLGLPICRRLAALHGATLTLTSAPGEGTSATLSFPPARSLDAALARASAA